MKHFTATRGSVFVNFTLTILRHIIICSIGATLFCLSYLQYEYDHYCCQSILNDCKFVGSNVISVLVYSYSGLASLCSVYRRLNDPAGGPLPLYRCLQGCLSLYCPRARSSIGFRLSPGELFRPSFFSLGSPSAHANQFASSDFK